MENTNNAMPNLYFRPLYATEIEVRISQTGNWGVQLLLYQTSRAAMNILDEAVGKLNWKRAHQNIAGKLFCEISIYNPTTDEWVSKSDVGNPSLVDSNKGESSDAFKRAAVNWGIGRELYNSPKIFISADHLSTLKNVNGKWKCNDFIKVADIQYNNDSVIYLKLYNCTTREHLEFFNN